MNIYEAVEQHFAEKERQLKREIRRLQKQLRDRSLKLTVLFEVRNSIRRHHHRKSHIP